MFQDLQENKINKMKFHEEIDQFIVGFILLVLFLFLNKFYNHRKSYFLTCSSKITIFRSFVCVTFLTYIAAPVITMQKDT